MTRGGWCGVAAIALASPACGDDPVDVRADPAAVPALDVLTTIPIPPDYGVHDVFVRDGLAFVSAWNTGLEIHDVGHGIRNGRPEAPALVSTVVPSGSIGAGRVHNAWWFHNPVSGEARYVFVGQEGPGALGASASGDLFVIDVSDLTRPTQVASFTEPGAGAHNVWVDEAGELLYAAFYNAGIITFNVSGTLTGDLTDRVVARQRPGGDDTFTWGVQLHQGQLYATDMLDGLYQLGGFGTTSPGFALGAVSDRFSSDLWLHGDWGFTGTWGDRQQAGNAVKIWRLTGSNPVLAGTLSIPDIGTVGDVEVSRDGRLLLAAAERGVNAGVHLFDVTVPDRPVYLARDVRLEGVHTATFGYVDGRVLVFASKNPPGPAVVVYDVTDN